jgi:hypothetical protein
MTDPLSLNCIASLPYTGGKHRISLCIVTSVEHRQPLLAIATACGSGLTFGYDDDAPKALPTSDKAIIAAKQTKKALMKSLVYCGSLLERKLNWRPRGKKPFNSGNQKRFWRDSCDAGGSRTR